jgi:alpha-beta hydrolase superfamily lysophospholipase
VIEGSFGSAKGSEPGWRAAAEAHKRAMPVQRLIGNGMDYADAVSLYGRVDEGQPWHEAASQLGGAGFDRAREAERQGHLATARSWYLAAAACYRVGQVPLPDGDPAKVAMYRQLIDAYGSAGALTEPPIEHVSIDWGGGQLMGWLLRPSTASNPPAVIVMGGFDGWREEYHVGATHLVERGLAVLLMDGPGQGETRLFGGLTMGLDVSDAFSAMIDYLQREPRLNGDVGIWGNSMGGFLAAHTAIRDTRLLACCVNGGTVRPIEFPLRFPRMVEKVQALLGIDDPDLAMRTLAKLELTADDLAGLRCPLLVLHGTPDQVFLVANARQLHDAAASKDKTWLEWADGDHCIYNHSLEKHTLIADWFADRLSPEPNNRPTPAYAQAGC